MKPPGNLPVAEALTVFDCERKKAGWLVDPGDCRAEHDGFAVRDQT
jgi:hypothetical protein